MFCIGYFLLINNIKRKGGGNVICELACLVVNFFARPIRLDLTPLQPTLAGVSSTSQVQILGPRQINWTCPCRNTADGCGRFVHLG